MPYTKGPAIGIDLGTRHAMSAFVTPGGAVSLIPSHALPRVGDRSARDLLISLFVALREDAEVYLGAFVSSCVLAVPARFSPAQREAMTQAALAAGLTETRLVAEPVAIALAFGRGGRFLILDFGAGAADLSVVEGEGDAWQVLESVGMEAVSGRELDIALADWLRERLLLPPGQGASLLLQEAERIKIALSDCASFPWAPPAGLGSVCSLTVDREDLERLARFPLRRLAHSVRRLWTQYRPSLLLLSGGSCRIPLLKEVLAQEDIPIERANLCAEGAIARGAALLTAGRGPLEPPSEGGPALQELKVSLIGIETALTRAQQDRLHLLFRRAESSISGLEMLKLLEGLRRDLKRSVGQDDG